MSPRAMFISAVQMVATLALVVGFSPALRGQESQANLENLRNPKVALFNEKGPDSYKAQFDTTVGTFVVQVTRAWAPLGADRFYNFVKYGFFDGMRFFRVTPQMAVWGVHPDTTVAKRWIQPDTKYPNDPEFVHSNKKGTIAFLQRGGRQFQTFVNLDDNPTLDFQITPFGEIISGMDVAMKIYAGYGDLFPTGKGPTMNDLNDKGDAFIQKEFPMMTQIKKAFIVP